MKIEDILPEVKENVSLAEHTTFKIGGPARYFFVAESKENLIKAVKAAKDLSIPFFILAGGSNVLFSDKGFNGLIIKFQMQPYGESACGRPANFKFQKNEIYVGAGVKLDTLANLAKENCLTGIEWAAGIPGCTVGGAVFGNAQAFGRRISDSVKKIEALDIRTLEIKEFSKEECCFSLKSSIFKTDKNLIILSVILELKKGDKEEIENKIKEHLNYRKEKHPMDFPSAGSVFINREIKIEDPELLREFPELNEFNRKNFIPSSFLIEKCGLKGKRIGNAQISEKHAGFIVNLGGAKSEDVLKLIELAKKKVKEKFKIELKEEIIIINN